jgi:hypothetical protein
MFTTLIWVHSEFKEGRIELLKLKMNYLHVNLPETVARELINSGLMVKW